MLHFFRLLHILHIDRVERDDEVSQQNAYFCEMLSGAVGKMIAVQADMVIKHGVLRAVYPDHIVLDVCHVPFYIRMDKIVWIS